MIPDYQTLMLPVLKSCANGEVSTAEVVESLAAHFKLSQEEQEQLLPSGKQTTFSNRINWAKGYLKQAGLLRYPSRGNFIITDTGQKALAENPTRIDNKFLMRYDAFQEFRNRKGTQTTEKSDVDSEPLSTSDATPDELLRSAHESINVALNLIHK